MTSTPTRTSVRNRKVVNEDSPNVVESVSAGLKKSSSSSSTAPLPLSERKIDILMIIYFVIFLQTTTFTDLHNFSASAQTFLTGSKVTVQDLEVSVMQKGESLFFPPRFLSVYYFEWARSVDPNLYQNPIWWQCIEWVNLLLLVPFSIFAIKAFYRGENWIRYPAIIVSSFTLYSVIVCTGSSMFSDDPNMNSKMPWTFFWVYFPYFFFPALVIGRVTHAENPFSVKMDSVRENLLKAGSYFTLITFFGAVLGWFYMCKYQEICGL